MLDWWIRELGSLGMPMRFTTCCAHAISITETRIYLILHFHGDHNPECHTCQMMCKSAWVRRAAANVAFNTMHAPVTGRPVKNELRHHGQERCYDRSALLGYPRHESDNYSEDSVQGERDFKGGTQDTSHGTAGMCHVLTRISMVYWF